MIPTQPLEKVSFQCLVLFGSLVENQDCNFLKARDLSRSLSAFDCNTCATPSLLCDKVFTAIIAVKAIYSHLTVDFSIQGISCFTLLISSLCHCVPKAIHAFRAWKCSRYDATGCVE
mgnify:CR=1 FL=1